MAALIDRRFVWSATLVIVVTTRLMLAARSLMTESFEPIDLFYAHIGGMDAFARGLKIAAAMRADGKLEEMLRDRYASWDTGLGAEIEAGKHTMASLEKAMLAKGEAAPNRSGRQELLENLINTYL